MSALRAEARKTATSGHLAARACYHCLTPAAVVCVYVVSFVLLLLLLLHCPCKQVVRVSSTLGWSFEVLVRASSDVAVHDKYNVADFLQVQSLQCVCSACVQCVCVCV